MFFILTEKFDLADVLTDMNGGLCLTTRLFY